MTDDLSNKLSGVQIDPRDELMLDLEAMLNMKAGRHVLMWMLGKAGLYGELFAIEPGMTELNIGRRDLGLQLLHKIEAVDPTAYPRLMIERANDKYQQEQTIVLDQADHDDDDGE